VKRRNVAFLVGGLLVALLLAGVVSNFASSAPDGLDATAKRGCTTDSQGNITGGTCMAQSEKDTPTKDSPFAGYGESAGSRAVAGAVGVLLTFAIGGGVFWLARRRTHATTDRD